MTKPERSESHQHQLNILDAEPPFTRTTCDCRGCTVGCRTMPGALIPRDIERIAAHQGKTGDGEWLTNHFLVSEGSRVGKRMLYQGRMTLVEFNVPTIVPAQKPNGECVFLQEGKCAIHEVSPFGCAYHDVHLSREDAQPRSEYAIRQHIAAHEQRDQYSMLCYMFDLLGLIATSTQQRRDAYEKMLAEVENEKPGTAAD